MEITANALQNVAANGIVVFSDVAVSGNPSILYRPGSGLVGLRGLTTQFRARFRVRFGANVALPTGGTATEPISLAIAINGEPLSSATMISTPGAVEQFNSVSRSVLIDVAQGCCAQISVENTSTEAIEVQNAILSVERVA